MAEHPHSTLARRLQAELDNAQVEITALKLQVVDLLTERSTARAALEADVAPLPTRKPRTHKRTVAR